MNHQYIPIYRAKGGEFDALANAKTSHAQLMLPLFEVSKITDRVRKLVKYRDCTAITCAVLDGVAGNIAKLREGQKAMVDISQWDPAGLTETGEHVLSYLYRAMRQLGVHVVPVIGFDSWESAVYRAAMTGVEITENEYYCLRFDSHAIEDAGDPEFLEDRIHEILNQLSIDPAQCAILLDFGDVTKLALTDLIGRTEQILDIVRPFGFRFISTAGCSLPPTIDAAVKAHDSTGTVIRKEMLLWQAMKTQFPEISWVFGDYGVRGPNSADDIIAPDANGKIRYTMDGGYFVARGHSMRQGDKGAQMYRLAEKITSSSYFMGAEFSWGDSQILLRSQALTDPAIKIGPGSHTTWIAIDTSHHLAWVMAEVKEFEQTLIKEKIANSSPMLSTIPTTSTTSTNGKE